MFSLIKFHEQKINKKANEKIIVQNSTFKLLNSHLNGHKNLSFVEKKIAQQTLQRQKSQIIVLLFSSPEYTKHRQPKKFQKKIFLTKKNSPTSPIARMVSTASS